MFSKKTKSRLFWGTAMAGASAAAYYIWSEMEKRAKDEYREQNRNSLMINGKPNRTGIQQGMENLDETCKVWEVALQEAIANEDIATANRIRQLLRRAYATVESFNNSFGQPGSGPASANRLMSLRGGSSAAGGSDVASFVSAETSPNFEQDLTGFDGVGGAGGDLGAAGVAARAGSSGVGNEHHFVASTPAQGSRTRSRTASFSAAEPLSPIASPVGGGVAGGAPAAGEDLWAEAVRLQREGKIEYRKDRAKECGVVTGDFGARLHCFRKAMNVIAAQPEKIGTVRNCVVRAISGLIALQGNDSAGFVKAIQGFEDYCTSQCLKDGGIEMLKELEPRKITVLSLYDLGFEFILFDSLDDLESPPQAVVNILQNSWVPTSVKSRGLRGVIWAALASRRALTAKNTFQRAFYDLCNHMSPCLACGMLGVGEKDFLDAVATFKELTMEWLCVTFAIPGTMSHMTEEMYAEKIMEKVRIYAPRILEAIATAVRNRDA